MASPLTGEQKQGIWLIYGSIVSVWSFRLVNQLTPLGYSFEEGELMLHLTREAAKASIGI